MKKNILNVLVVKNGFLNANKFLTKMLIPHRF